MKSSSALKKPLYSALVFFGTLGVLSAGYAGFVSLQSSDADSGKSLTSSMMQAVIGNLADLDSRVSTMSGAVSSLQSGAGNLWSAVTGGIGYSGGKVGIGTDTPGAELQVQNSLTTGTPIDNAGIIIKSTNRNAYIALDATPTSAGSVVFYNSGTEKGRIAYYNSNNSLAFQTNTTDRMTIDSSGNVGIGITPTVYKLDVNGPARVSGLVGPTSGNFHLDSATSTSGLYLNWASG